MFFHNLVDALNEYDNLILVGDFNCSIVPDIDVISGQPHEKIESNSFKKSINILGLTDIWRQFLMV